MPLPDRESFEKQLGTGSIPNDQEAESLKLLIIRYLLSIRAKSLNTMVLVIFTVMSSWKHLLLS